MKVSDYIANYLYDRGIKVVFGYQGGMVTHIIDSIGQHSMLEYIQCYLLPLHPGIKLGYLVNGC